ncbi:hypothetical protein AB0J35_18225 [Nonomuraea angiospora]|uniref:hypothetical protein n=1 Tax=Nonomuraea angiospora TaxID=46172 RepID=UPI003413E995
MTLAVAVEAAETPAEHIGHDAAVELVDLSAGLLKAVLDRLISRALAGTVALPLLVMDDARHALAVEVPLRPLLVELGVVPTPGLALVEADLPRLPEVLERWQTAVTPQVKGGAQRCRQGVTAARRRAPR